MKKLLLAFALAFAPAPVLAQAAAPTAPAAAALPDADPALWVVRDEDTIIYLFGTFHMLDGRTWFNDEIRAAFDASDELVLEAKLPENPAELQPMIVRYAVDPQGRRLSQRLSEAQNAALGRVLSEAGVPAAAFDPLEPWFVAISLPGLVGQQRLGLRAEHGPEAVLSAAARERGIEILELEGLEWQFRLFDSMPDDQQIALLGQSLEKIEEIAEQLGPMLAAWSIGDTGRLAEMLNASSREDPALHRLLFTERNATWAAWIVERLERPGTVFVAVGAGHLAGEDSVPAVLAARGIATERVPSTKEAAPAF